MKDEMTTTIVPPLVQLPIVKSCRKKKKKWQMMKQMLEGDGMILLLLTSLILYGVEVS